MFTGMSQEKREKDEAEWLYGRPDQRKDLFTGDDIDSMMGTGTMHRLSEARELMDKMKEAERNYTKSDDTGAADQVGKYGWDQAEDDITVHFELPEGVKAKELLVDMNSTTLKIVRKAFRGKEEELLLRGTLLKKVKSDEKVWSVADGVLSITVPKQAQKVHWLTFFEGGKSGEEGYERLPPPKPAEAEEASKAQEHGHGHGGGHGHSHGGDACDGNH